MDTETAPEKTTTAIEVRSLAGLPRNRAGLRFDVAWTAVEVTPEQLAAIKADKHLEIRGTRDSDGKALAAAQEAAGGLVAEVAQLRLLVADRDARIAELEGELERAQATAQAALRDLEELTSPAAPVSPTVEPKPEA